MDLGPRRIPISHPVMSAVYTVQDAHCRIPGILSANPIGILNAHTRLRGTSKVRELTHRKHWRLSITLEDCCSEWPILLVQCQLINVNKLASGEEQGPSS
jgi:hypothetical protein